MRVGKLKIVLIILSDNLAAIYPSGDPMKNIHANLQLLPRLLLMRSASSAILMVALTAPTKASPSGLFEPAYCRFNNDKPISCLVRNRYRDRASAWETTIKSPNGSVTNFLSSTPCDDKQGLNHAFDSSGGVWRVDGQGLYVNNENGNRIQIFYNN
jgi:hypothetical protein